MTNAPPLVLRGESLYFSVLFAEIYYIRVIDYIFKLHDFDILGRKERSGT